MARRKNAKSMRPTFFSNGAFCVKCKKEYTESCFWARHIFE